MRLTSLLADVDRLLHARPADRAHDPAGRSGLRTLLVAGLVLGAVYGACMGLYGVLAPRPVDYPAQHRWLQFLATSLKVPLVFLLTYAICAPSLYVFATLAGSRERPRAIVRMLLARNAECLAVVASLGPVTAFFTLSTESYPFMKLLNVLVFGVGGAILVVRLRAALLDVSATAAPQAEAARDSEPEATPDEEAPPSGRRPPARRERAGNAVAHRILSGWLVVLAMVGAQVAWILRPFLGAPHLPFSLFRSREDSFYLDLLRTLGQLFS